MPFFAVQRTVPAATTEDFLNLTAGVTTPWKYNRAPYPGILEVMLRSVGAPAAGLSARITVGSDEVMQTSPIGAGGVAQSLPSRLNTEPITFEVDQGDVISVLIINPGGVGVEVDATFELTRKK